MGREVGIDLEHIQPELADLRVAEQYFSPQEFAMLRALPDHLQTEAFFRCWTSKEAYIKAIGEGLSFCLDQIEVSVGSRESTVSLRIKGDPLEASRWLLRELNIGAKYIATLAVKAHGWKLKCWQWEIPIRG
jgi:4'-phosphopantetheinyl transferase